MSKYNYDRLSGQDTSFLLLETTNLHMHVASTQIFEVEIMANEAGGIDFASFKRFTASVLHRIPRYRQKLKWIPVEERPVWFDDSAFDIDHHIRHTSLPKPGSEDQLKSSRRESWRSSSIAIARSGKFGSSKDSTGIASPSSVRSITP